MKDKYRKKQFKKLAIADADQLIFGKSKYPVVCGNNLNIGGGTVFPEINFTLPPMQINEDTWKTVLAQYEEIANSVIDRAKKMMLPGLVIEFEQLPPMTEHPQWGAEITRLLKDHLNRLFEDTGMPNALRVTVVDFRDAERPPLLREGKSWEITREAFVCAAQAGADILSIESVGGKEVHDQALIYGDLSGIICTLGSLSVRDMSFLWNEISNIAAEYNAVSGGDTACGFSNTAMQLAGKGMIPTILAALDRAASAPRSLAAFENGAVGPSKDCAYEGPIIKAITGYPISMEGKSSCCAHFSPLGNIAGACTDLWSNESVQNVRLLSGSAPEAFMELLAYDCRLFNSATKSGEPLKLRDWLVGSDVPISAEAIMLDPDCVIKIAESIVKFEDGYSRTLAAVQTAFDYIQTTLSEKRLILPESEQSWIGQIQTQLDAMPDTEEEALQNLNQSYGQLYRAESYGL